MTEHIEQNGRNRQKYSMKMVCISNGNDFRDDHSNEIGIENKMKHSAFMPKLRSISVCESQIVKYNLRDTVSRILTGILCIRYDYKFLADGQTFLL